MSGYPLDILRELASACEAAARCQLVEHDWEWRAERTIADLRHAPAATRIEYNDLYVLPYPNGQYPDSMVQLALISALQTYARAQGRESPLASQLWSGVHRFYDPSVQTLRRYLPNIGEEKDYDAVDSWYLYHPLSNLARLALDGSAEARDLLLGSVEYGIRAAHHFSYAWPVLYKIDDFTVIQQQMDADRPGESDAGGLYAYLMVQLAELTGETRYLDEARAALRAATAAPDALMYQTNLTAWGAAACVRLYRVQEEREWWERCHLWLAALMRHVRTDGYADEHALGYPTFMASPCMYNSAYIAPFEDHECYTALGEILALGGSDLDPAADLLAREFRRRARHRAWYCYPDMLPGNRFAQEQEAGIIDRSLSFPLEDLYFDRRPVGQVGQEIYGAGAALIYAADSSPTH
jgi:hypothetical protein